MSRTFSGKLFDRPVHGRMGAELAAMAQSALAKKRAAGTNLECDWRVSKQREREFYGMFDTSVPDRDQPQSLSGMMDVYFRDRVRGQTIPDFLRRHNIDNLNNDLRPDAYLVNTYRVPPIPSSIAAGANAVGLASLPFSNDATAVLKTVFPANPFRLGSPDGAMTLEADQHTFLEKFLKSADKPNRHPVWAGLWDEFRPILELGPDGWLAAMGVRDENQRLCLLFRYRLEDCEYRPLFRPTYLDAEACPEHFPSPSASAPARSGGGPPAGGHPMSLLPETDRGSLLQEFIHQDFVRRPDMVFAWGWTNASAPQKGLEQARRDHYDKLSRYYDHLDEWLKEPI